MHTQSFFQVDLSSTEGDGTTPENTDMFTGAFECFKNSLIQIKVCIVDVYPNLKEFL